jgi:hypothetical protein
MDVNIVDFREHFLSGDSIGASGSAPIGEQGWHGDSNPYSSELQIPGEPGHPGIVRIRTTGQGPSTYPGFARLACGNSTAAHVHSGDITRFRAIIRVGEPNGDGDFTDEGIFVGFGVKPDAYLGGPDLGNDCIFFSFRPSANAKWQAGCQTMNPLTGLPDTTLVTSSGADLALNTWYVLEAVNTAGSWEFFVDGVSIGTVNTNVPNDVMTPQFRITTQQVHATGYAIDLDCDEFAHRLTLSNPGLNDW